MVSKQVVIISTLRHGEREQLSKARSVGGGIPTPEYVKLLVC